MEPVAAAGLLGPWRRSWVWVVTSPGLELAAGSLAPLRGRQKLRVARASGGLMGLQVGPGVGFACDVPSLTPLPSVGLHDLAALLA